MIKTSTLGTLAFLLLTGSTSNAQLLWVKNSEGQVLNSTTVTLSGPADMATLSAGLPVTFNGSSTTEVNVKRYEQSVVPGTGNYFCWFDCFLEAAAGAHAYWVSEDAVPLAPAQVFGGFYADYKPHGISGTSCFRFVWYAVADTTDSVWVDICFEVTPVGINEAVAQAQRLDILPNPSSGEVTMQFDASSSGPRTLTLHNALGEMVRSTPIPAAQRKVTLSEGSLPPGVWFASLQVNGRAVTTSRFVITSH